MKKTRTVSIITFTPNKMRSLTFVAEDFYGNDYPDEELDLQDEYNHDPYMYRNNASDDEEFDGEEATWSDDNLRTHAQRRRFFWEN